jgi:hypothetical protein
VGPDSQHAEPDGGSLRASDTDRDQTVETLARASAEGRLTLEEYSQRSEAALAAKTLGDLAGLTSDLPASALPVVTRRVPGESEEIVAVLGNESRKGPWVVPEHMTVRSILGDCHLEMQEAVLGQRVTTIDATAKFGSISIFVPDGVDVRMSGKAVLGAKSSELRGEPRHGAPVLIVRCDVFCGNVTVRRPDWMMRRRAAKAAALESGRGGRAATS